MAWLTDIARKRPLGPGNPPTKMARHDIICLHTMVGYLVSTDVMFKREGYTGVESHFGVGGDWGSDKNADLDGVIYQWVDTEYRADANLEGNHRLISIETADNAPAKAADIKPWTPNQVAAIIRLVTALCKRYDIPAALVPDSKSTRRGIAYHRQGIEPWRVDGGELWSAANGKECPGDARIAQITSVIIPGVKALLNPVKPQEDDMAEWLASQHKLSETDAKAYGGDAKEGDTKSGSELLRYPPAVARLRREMDEKLDAILAKLNAPEA